MRAEDVSTAVELMVQRAAFVRQVKALHRMSPEGSSLACIDIIGTDTHIVLTLTVELLDLMLRSVREQCTQVERQLRAIGVDLTGEVEGSPKS